MNKETKQAIELQNEFNYISPRDIEEIMEWLEDNEFLSEEGMDFREVFWELFIKEKRSKY